MGESKVSTFSSALVAIFVVGVVIRIAKPVLFPFFLAVFFYFVLSPILDLLTIRFKVPKSVALAVILLLTFLSLYLLGMLFFTSGQRFAIEFPKYGERMTQMIDSLEQGLRLPRIRWEPLAWLQSLDINKVGSFFLASLGTLVTFISNLFLVLIFLVFMLAGRGKLCVKIGDSFPAHRAAQLNKIVDRIDQQVQKYLGLKTLISILSGLLAGLILVIFGVKFAVLFGFLTFVLNYIPNIGSFIAKIFPFAFAVLQFESLWKAVWVLIVLFAVDAVVGMIVEPRLMGHSLGLSPLAILFALFFWGWLWGIPGMILAVPILVVLKIVSANIPSLKFLEALLSK